MSDSNGNKGRAVNVSVENELFQLFRHSESLSEESLRELFERHGLTPNSNNNILIGDNEFFLWACFHERVTEGIIRLFLEYFPDVAKATKTNERGWSPLHHACGNPSVTLNIIQLLIDADPESVRSVTIIMPLFYVWRIKWKNRQQSKF